MKYLIALLASFTTFIGLSQVNDTAFALVRTYRGDITGAALDNLDNLYLVSTTGQVKKFSPRGDSIGVFNGVRAYGKLHNIDISNPLKPLLFYKNFSSVVVLDRFLAVRTTVDLRRFNMLQPSAIGLAYDNNIWVFDQLENKLRKIDENGIIQTETSDFRQLFGRSIAPQKIISDNNLVYVADSAAGVFVFDNYGTFQRKIDLRGWSNLEVRNGYLVRLNTTEIVVYNPSTFLEQKRPLPARFQPYQHSFLQGNKLITFSTDSLSLYRVSW